MSRDLKDGMQIITGIVTTGTETASSTKSTSIIGNTQNQGGPPPPPMGF